MDKEVPEKSFSSQNVKLGILKIIKKGTKKGKTEILLSDGSSFFIINRMVLENNLEAKTFLSKEKINELKSHSEYISAKKKALGLLGTYEHSVFQLKQKLLIRNFDLQIVLRVLEELKNEGSLSNSRFIEAWVSSRLKKHPEGFRSLYSGLINSGISSNMAREYLIPFMETIDLDKLIKKAAAKIFKKNNITRDKLIRGLKNRGFEDSTIILFVENYYNK